jgi:hypothetical protein
MASKYSLEGIVCWFPSAAQSQIGNWSGKITTKHEAAAVGDVDWRVSMKFFLSNKSRDGDCSGKNPDMQVAVTVNNNDWGV